MMLRRWASSSSASSFALAPTIRQILAQKTKSKAIDASDPQVTVSGWIKSIRKQKNVSFAVITDGSTPAGLQAVLVKGRDDSILRRLTNGAAVQLTGQLVPSPGAGQSHELLIDESKHHGAQVVVLGECDPDAYPIQKKALSTEYLRDNVHLRARTSHIAAMVRLRDGLSRRINTWFEAQGFVYAHTPILTANDAEGGGEAFRLSPIQTHHPASSTPSASPSTAPPPPVEFFSQPAFLTVSHQLHLESLTTAISRTYTLSPCFRAELSQTGRHLAEFWMLEAEWAFAPGGVGGICDLTEALLKETVGPLFEARDPDVETLWEGGDQTRRQALENALSTSSGPWARMTYTEAISHLEKAAQTEAFVYPPIWGNTLQSEHERWLAESLVGGPVFVTDYPANLKPFYMRENDAAEGARSTVACFDLLIPHVGELIGGSVREERADVLERKMRLAGLLPDPTSGERSPYEWYLDLRRYGGAPHGGFGMGFERLLGWVGGIENVRECIPMPRWAGRMLL